MSRPLVLDQTKLRSLTMDLPFDIVYTIGRHCDPQTRVNLCLASKDFYLSDTDWLKLQRVRNFSLQFMEKLREVQGKESRMAIIKGIHKIFRFLVENKEHLKHPMFTRFIPTLKAKLEEYKETGMCKRKVKKYMIELDLF